LPFLVVFLVVHFLLNVVLSLLKPYYANTGFYGYVYYSFHAVLLCASLYMAECLWRAGLTEYEGFHRLSLISGAVTMGVLLGFVAFIFSASPGPSLFSHWISLWFTLINRSVQFVVAGVVLALFVFASVFRVRMSQTVRNLGLSLLALSIARGLLQSWAYDHNNQTGLLWVWTWQLSIAVTLGSWGWIVVHHRVEAVSELPRLLPSNTSREDLELRAQAANRRLVRLLGYGAQ